jgi:hypothetical protein
MNNSTVARLPAQDNNGMTPDLSPEQYAKIVSALRAFPPPKRTHTTQDDRAKAKRIEKRRAQKKAANRARRVQRRK